MTSIVGVSIEPNTADHYLKQPYARIILPESDGSFRGEIMEFPGCIATGESAAQALENLEEAAIGWISAVLERGQNIPRPIESSNDFSGRLVLRLPKSLHKKATWIAEREGVSLNQFITTSLSESVGEKYYSRNTVSISSVQYNAQTHIQNYMPIISGSGLLGHSRFNLVTIPPAVSVGTLTGAGSSAGGTITASAGFAGTNSALEYSDTPRLGGQKHA